MKVAPDDPPLSEDPVFIPSCYKDPYDRLNRPFVVDYKGGNVGDHDENNDVSDWDNLDDSLNREDDDVMDEDTEINTEESVPRILRVSVQDVGSGIPLPSYGSNQPNHDYFASNITLHNMNFLRRR